MARVPGNKVTPRRVLGVAGSLYAGFSAIQEFREKRQNGRGLLYSALSSYISFRIYNNPWMLLTAIPPVMGAMAGRAQNNMRSVRQQTAVFLSGNVPDSDSIRASKQALIQSSVAANQNLRLMGTSWAGNEAALLHRR